MATLNQVAEMAGISVTTASRVLNNTASAISISEKTRRKVLKAVQELGYKPNIFARSLRTKKTAIIGVVVSEIADPYFSEMLDGIEKILNEWNYHFFLSSAQNNPEREEHYLSILKSRYIDGFLIVGSLPFARSICKAMKESEVPIILIGRVFNASNVRCVSLDNFKGEFLATEYLIKQGNSNILYITRGAPSVDGKRRLEGYKSAMEKHNLETRIVKGGISAEAGYSVMADILQKPRIPTSVLTFNDRCALGVMSAIKSRNLQIPQDIAVIGYDNLAMSKYFSPALSTVDQSVRKMATVGTAMLMKMLNNPKEVKPENIILQPELIIRKSCKQ